MEQTRKTAVKPIVMTVRLGGRRMTLTWRPRKRMPGLLHALLSRSLRALAGVLLGGISAAALAQVSASALPTGGQLVAGQALISQLSNQMRVSQTTDKAIINWNTFNIGSAARVDFQMPSSTSAVLNRVITNNPSSLMGALTGNGRVWLINPAGIMVGPGATIDVAGFIGSTLSVRNEDFLADRLNFSGSGAGVSNFGSITTPQGGNVYLVGSSVENQGLIRAPGGEVLLAAGQTVEIADTGTPGVKVAITGTEGSALNVGQVLAEAGRVGMAGVLVRNAGSINASSVVKEGGRIFLRATRSVTTDASSVIEASGTSGGDIRLVAEETAFVDGSLVARGSQGRGGFVETSGKKGFAILRAPDVGPGGEWLIDPNNISVRAAERTSDLPNNPDSSSTGDTAVVTTELLQEALNAGTNVSIVTTAEPGTESGDINVFDAIVKAAGTDATLTLSAQRNINLQQAITATSGKLNVALSHAGTAALSNSIALNGGSLSSSGQLIFSGATLDNVNLGTNGTGTMASIVTGGTTSLVGGSTWNNYGQVDFQGAGKLQLANGTSFSNMVGGTVNLTGYADKAIASTGGSVFNSGMINKFGSGYAAIDNLTNIGTVNVHLGKLSLTGSGSYGGTFNVHSDAGGGAATVLAFAPGVEQTAVLSGAAINLLSSEGVDNALVDFSGEAGSATYLNNDLNLARATMTGGALDGSGKLTVTDFGWSGGTITGASGAVAYGFTNLALSGNTRLDGRRLVLAAGGTSNAQFANLVLANNAQVDNLGVLNLMEGSRIGYPLVGGDDVNTQASTFGSLGDDGGAINSIGAINNAGTINSVSYGANNWLGGSSGEGAVTFNNNGIVNVNAGTLKLAGGVHSGTFNVNAGTGDIDTVLRFAPSAAFGAGAITLASTAVINQNGSNNATATIAFGSAHPNGVVNINGDLSLQRVALEGSILQGPGKLSASQLDVSGGTLRGTGSGPSWDFGQLNLANHLGIDNRAVNLGPDGSSTALEGAGLHLTNGSVLTSTGTHSVGSIDNAGVLRVNSGTLSATRLGNYGSLAVGSDARFAVSSELTNFEHGTVSGTGTIEVVGGEGTLQNFGRLQPGAAGEIGTLTIRGGLQQGTAASMEIKLGGKETGMFDRVSVSGDVALGGSLLASYQNDYKPAVGDAIPFLLADGQRTGTFQTVVAGEHMQAGYSLFAGEATRLTALPPAP
ncbi:MAG: filamentous hemagglutinin N-terminal domain-containing protein, partial [Lacisediminimonas sp.]|nr:filamentous hemagglutinin N-terminal domain-containing protein [Lacisediminimonas sp.]